MSGPNAPWSKALEWCGWETIPYDILIDQSHDLSDPAVQARVLIEIERADALLWEMDCNSLTRARERPIAGERHPPPPLRGKGQHVMGLPALQDPHRAADLRKVQKANDLVIFSGKTLAMAHKQGSAIVAENPRNAYYWLFKCIQYLLTLLGVFMVEYMACALAGARAKKQSLLTNVEELRTMASVCRHVHAEDEWERTRGPTGRWEYPTGEEAEFTAELAFGTATRLSFWAVRMGRAKLRLARFPITPTETGRRDIMIRLPPSATRLDAMVGMGLRLGLGPPAAIAHHLPRFRSLAEGVEPSTMTN